MKYQCCHHIETSQLICYANQLTGFYLRAKLTFYGLSVIMVLREFVCAVIFCGNTAVLLTLSNMFLKRLGKFNFTSRKFHRCF